MRTEAVIFDFDGLLIDTETTMFSSWQYEWRQHGLELDRETFFADHGGDLTAERYRLLAEAVGPGYELDASRARREAYRNALNEELRLRDGIGAWLEQAHDAGLRCAVASSSPESWVAPLLRRKTRVEDFEVLAYGNEVGSPKPAPDVYVLALDRLGLDAKQAIAVEDTPHGVAAAKAAGLVCVAIPNPHADSSRFGAADLVLTSAADGTLHDVIGAAHRKSFDADSAV